MLSFDVYLKQRLTEIDTIITQLSQIESISGNTIFYLLTHGDVTQRKYIQEIISKFVLNGNRANGFSKKYVGGNTLFRLSGNSAFATAQKELSGSDRWKLFGNPDAFSRFLCENAETKFSIQTDSVDLVFQDSIGEHSRFVLDTNGDIAIIKALETASTMTLRLAGLRTLGELDSSTLGELDPFTLDELDFSAPIFQKKVFIVPKIENKMTLSGEASIVLGRYRTLEELDGLRLEEMDGMRLRDLDFEIIV